MPDEAAKPNTTRIEHVRGAPPDTTWNHHCYHRVVHSLGRDGP